MSAAHKIAVRTDPRRDLEMIFFIFCLNQFSFVSMNSVQITMSQKKRKRLYYAKIGRRNRNLKNMSQLEKRRKDKIQNTNMQPVEYEPGRIALSNASILNEQQVNEIIINELIETTDELTIGDNNNEATASLARPTRVTSWNFLKKKHSVMTHNLTTMIVHKFPLVDQQTYVNSVALGNSEEKRLICVVPPEKFHCQITMCCLNLSTVSSGEVIQNQNTSCH